MTRLWHSVAAAAVFLLQLAYAAPIYKPIEGRDVLYEKPAGEVKGVVFMAHGCSHSGTDFWGPSEACPQCLGLPEEKRIVKRLLARGYVPLAISSADRLGTRCWDIQLPLSASNDISFVVKAVEQVRSEEGWASLPLYAFGASSGGYFVMVLPFVMKLDGICPQIAAMPVSGLERAGDIRTYPPTLFVHMPRDQKTLHHVKTILSVLKHKDIPAAEIEVRPLSINATFFADRIEGFPLDRSQAIFDVLMQSHMLNEDGTLIENPRGVTTYWQTMLKDAVPLGTNMIPDASPISELLNVAYATHEIISDTTDDMVDFFEARGDLKAIERDHPESVLVAHGGFTYGHMHTTTW